ncbi:MAG: hypothetical protein AAF511_03650, partial [Pseudomonadota bacterium]
SSMERCLVDTVFTVEELADKIEDFLEATGVPRVKAAKIEVGTFNKSPTLSIDMTAEDLERIVHRYEVDFELFGYNPEVHRSAATAEHGSSSEDGVPPTPLPVT